MTGVAFIGHALGQGVTYHVEQVLTAQSAREQRADHALGCALLPVEILHQARADSLRACLVLDGVYSAG